MKKNISINISGIIFHIEEDGYEKLKNYLDSINKYFSAFDDSKEIIADIESRIAEIFLARLSETKQVITHEDVEVLVTTMGSIEDFQAIEDSEPDPFRIDGEEKTKDEPKSKRLYRDSRRKIIGGVASGIANYFTIDPLWIRLLFIVLAFDIFITTTISGVTILGYIILWIVLPDSDELPEDKKVKKMYRNPDDRVIGGVASGVAAYFGIDVVVIRVLFILSIFLGGAGIITYIILWIILPEATTITEKVQMKGDPVTLENIESNIKNSLNVKEDGEESTLVKVLLFPFRLIATVAKGLAKALGPVLMFLVDFIRIAFGLALSMFGIGTLVALSVALGVALGLIVDIGWLNYAELPLDAIRESFPVYAIMAAYLAIAIPSLGFILLGITVISRGRVGNATVGWTMFALWILSLIILAFSIPKIVYQFKAEGVYRNVEYYELNEKTAILTINEIGMDDYEDGVQLRLLGYEGDQYKLVQEFESRGTSRRQAIENAQMVSYNVDLDDSVFTFDSNIVFEAGSMFRGQNLDMTLYIPYYSKFKMTYDLRHIIRNTIYRNGYRESQMDDNIWQFTPEKLECITCEDLSVKEPDEKDPLADHVGKPLREFDLAGFRTIEVYDNYLLKIEKSRNYEVLISGREIDLDATILELTDETLTIRRRNENGNVVDLKNLDNRVEVLIRTPFLNAVRLNGSSKARVNNFKANNMDIRLTGVSDAVIHSEINTLEADLNGASRLKLEGHGNTVHLKASGTSHINGSEFEVTRAFVRTQGGATAKINASEIVDAFAE